MSESSGSGESGGSFGPYELLSLLGRGGMGEVYRAHDTATDRIVAIKLLPAHLAEDREFRQRFQREARTAAGLNDPHVVPIHNYGEIDGRLYVDMRLIEGRDLATLIAEGRLSAGRAVAIVEQVAAALNSAHHVGLVHRDVKPSNILVTENDFAYLIDFGIARGTADTAMTGTGHMVGTLAYMAPERFSGTADARADVYALACVLYECLTGQRPYPGDSLEQQIAGHLSAPPPQPSRVSADVPAGLDEVIYRGLAKDPEQRYQTAREFADAALIALGRPLDVTQLGPPPAFTPRVSTPPSAGLRIARYAAVLLTLAVGVSLAFLIVAGGTEPSVESQGGVRVTLTPRAGGPAPTSEALSKAENIVRSRVRALGISGAQVSTVNGKVVVTVPANRADDLRKLGAVGRLLIRPVLNAMPTQPATTEASAPPTAPPAAADPADRIADEKKIRQPTSQYLQMVAMQFEAARCDQPDVLQGNDDPALPLITCSTDHKSVYLLGPSIISGDHVKDASVGKGPSGVYVVDMLFDSAAANTWATFTAANVGTQTAFVMDTQVISAPVISEAIPGGRTQIANGDPPFTETAARQFAAQLKFGSLPLAFDPSQLEPVPAKPGAQSPSAARIVGIAVVSGLLLVLLGVSLYLYRQPIRRLAGRA